MSPTPSAPLPFGKYLLLEKIASGGMAEVFRAVLRGAAGFEKLVAVKRILPAFNEEPEFITLFQDEARIASTLAHANIAQVFELGEVDGTYYLAQELVEGVDLGRLVARLKAAQQPMPLPTAAFIVAEAARGLAHAHDKTAADGRLIGIVHRDVSPPNVLLSRSGDVKVADFGIAKAAGKVHKTETGVLMGKLKYMSPEQLAGDELDGRSDIFSLGVVLYELLTGGPIFKGEQTVRLAELIQNAEIPRPSTRNADIPGALDDIVMKSLARPRDDRYARAADLARDLSLFLAQSAPGFTREDLAALVSSLAPPTVSATMPTELAIPVSGERRVAPTRDLSPPRPETLPPVRRRSFEGMLGVLLLAVIAGSGALVLVRFVLPSGKAPTPDAAKLVLAAPDAGPAVVEPPPTAPFTLVPTGNVEERRLLLSAVEKFDIARRGLRGGGYEAFLTGLDSVIAGLVLDAEGHAAEAPPLPPRVEEMVRRANVGDALAATVAYLRASGELPPLVKNAADNFFRLQRVSVMSLAGAGAEPYAAPVLAVWLDPGNKRRLHELAYANELLHRFCPSEPAPRRHFVPAGCEQAELIQALRKLDRNDPVARALEEWEAAVEKTPEGLEAVAAYEAVTAPDKLRLVVKLSGPAPAAPSLSAGGVSPALPLEPVADQPDTYAVAVPLRLVAPVVKMDAVTLRLKPPPFPIE